MMSRWAVVLSLGLLLGTSCASTRAVRLDTGQGQPWEYVPPTQDRSVEVLADDFQGALTRLVLELPLPLRPVPPGSWVLASYPGTDTNTPWQRLMGKSFVGLCKSGQRRPDCLSLLDDVAGFTEWDKLGVAMGLSLEPLKASISQAVEDTLAPQLFYTVIATGLISWATLAANPEPVFTKAAAIVSAVMLIYLGVETFLALVQASRDLKRATDRATTLEELDHAGQRFAHRVGPEVARIFVLAVTVVVSHGMNGSAASMASRLSGLPRFSEAAALGASQVAIRLSEVGQVSAVAVVDGSIILTLAPTAVAMAAQDTGGGNTLDGRFFKSFESFKRAMGPAGFKKQWHHIVEQTESNVERFGPEAIHNTKNVIRLEEPLHREVSRLYSQIRRDITGSDTLTIRKWLSTQSLEEQRRFGLLAIENVRKGLWP